MNDTFETIEELRRRCDSYGVHDPGWYEKMIHHVPDAPVVERHRWLADKCRGKVVLSLGASGPMQDEIDKVAKSVWAVDIERLDRPQAIVADLNFAWEFKLPQVPDVVVAGEVLEHLFNPGTCLDQISAHTACPLLVTVPNAFSGYQPYWSSMAKECVNDDHVAWYSYWTLKTLLRKTGWKVVEWAWYGGKPFTAEGLCVEAVQEMAH